MAGLMNKGWISTTYVNPVDKGGKGWLLPSFAFGGWYTPVKKFTKSIFAFGDPWIALSFKKYIHRYLCKPDLHRRMQSTSILVSFYGLHRC